MKVRLKHRLKSTSPGAAHSTASLLLAAILLQYLSSYRMSDLCVLSDIVALASNSIADIVLYVFY